MTIQQSFWLAATAVLMWAISGFLIKESDFWRWLFYAFGVVAFIYASITVAMWLYQGYIDAQLDLMEHENKTELVLLAEAMKYWKAENIGQFLKSPYALKIAQQMNLDKGELNFEQGIINPKTGEWIPITEGDWNLSHFLDLSNEQFLRPVRDYTDSEARRHAIAFTQACVDAQIAAPATGNKSAQWLDPIYFMRTRARVRRAI